MACCTGDLSIFTEYGSSSTYLHGNTINYADADPLPDDDYESTLVVSSLDSGPTWRSKGYTNRHNLPLAWHAATDMHECYRLGNDCIQFKLSHKPGVAGLSWGG